MFARLGFSCLFPTFTHEDAFQMIFVVREKFTYIPDSVFVLRFLVLHHLLIIYTKAVHTYSRPEPVSEGMCT